MGRGRPRETRGGVWVSDHRTRGFECEERRPRSDGGEGAIGRGGEKDRAFVCGFGLFVIESREIVAGSSRARRRRGDAGGEAVDETRAASILAGALDGDGERRARGDDDQELLGTSDACV